MIVPQSIDHLVFRVADPVRSESFYSSLLGPPDFKGDGIFMYLACGMRLFFTTSAEPPVGPYKKDNVGLNHLAFGVATLEELQGIAAQLDAAKITHSGIKIDVHGKKEYVWLDDPDGMRVEFYLREE